MKYQPRKGPKIEADPDYAAAVSIFSKLYTNEIEFFFYRLVRDRTTAIILRELTYWLSEAGAKTGYPRAKVYRDEFYWVARTKKEWLQEHGIDRKDVERAYLQAKGFVVRKVYKFSGQPTTHWRFDYVELLGRLRKDAVIRERLFPSSTEVTQGNGCLDVATQADLRNSSDCEPPLLSGGISECIAPPAKPGILNCAGSTGDTVHPHIQASEQSHPTTTSTGSAGPANAGTGTTSPSAPSGADAPEPPSHAAGYLRGGTLDPARILSILASVRGLSWEEKRARVPQGNRRVVFAVLYMMLWQIDYEDDHPKRRCPFTNRDVQHAWELSEEEVNPNRFNDVLIEAHNILGPKKGPNPVFMSEHHSQRFGSFCKHFTRIEDELVNADCIKPA